MSGQPPQPTPMMSDDPAGDCTFCRDHLGAFVLKSLDRVDRGLVEQHLRWCDDCRIELAQHEAVTIGLGLQGGDTGAPADSVWASIRERIDRNDDQTIPQHPTSTASTSQTPMPTRSSRWLPISAIAPLALAVILLSAWSWSLHRDLAATESELSNHALLNSTLTNSQQVQLYSMEQSCPTCDGVGQVGVSEANGMGMVVGWDFDPQMTHDVWGIDHEGERSRVCSLLIAQDGGVMQMFSFPDSPSKYTDIVITDQMGNLVYQSHIVAADKEIPPAESPTS